MTTQTMPSSGIEWKNFYAQLELKGHVPFAEGESIDANHAVFRAMYLDLAEVKATVFAGGAPPPLVTIYADVLSIPAGTVWSLDGSALVIVARLVLAGDASVVALDFRRSTGTSFIFFANEVQGALQVVTQTDGQPNITIIDAPPPTGGVDYTFQGAPVALPLTRAQGMAMQPGDDFVSALRTEYLFAALLYDQQPPLALSMLTFLKDWAGASQDLLGVFLRSTSLLGILTATVNARVNGAAFVPYLTSDIYTQLAAAYVAEAQQYERDYQELSTQKVVTDRALVLAKALLDNQIYQGEYVDQLVTMAKANYDNAVAAVGAALKNLSDARTRADLTRIDFEKVGIPEWTRAEIVKAIIELSMAAIEFAVGIGSVLFGNEAGGAAAAGAAVSAADAVAEAADTAPKVAGIAKALAESMENLEKVGEMLNKLGGFVQAVVTVAQNLDEAGKFLDQLRDTDLSVGQLDVTGTFEWQIYQVQADSALEEPVQMKIGYARELKVAIDSVAILGQAVAAAQVAAVTAGQQYTTVLLQRDLARRQQARLAQAVSELKAGDELTVSMMQDFYERYIDAKSALFAALQNYRASFFYWALEPSQIDPKIIDSVGIIDTGLTTLTSFALDRQHALDRFSPPPQTMSDKRFVVDDPDVLARLRATGITRWTLPLDALPFDGFERVRLNTVRMWIDGLQPGSSGSITVTMSNPGNYLDRFGGRNYQFTSRPLTRKFQYRVSDVSVGSPAWRFPNGTYGYIEVDGSVDREVSYAYFEPTAFGEWQLDLTRNNAGIDYSNVTRITMEFAGSVIPTVDATAMARRRTARRAPAAQITA